MRHCSGVRMETSNQRSVRRRRMMNKRQSQIADMIASGDADKQIAGALNCSIGTVRYHVANIRKHLRCKSRAQIAGVWALRQVIGNLEELAKHLTVSEAKLLLLLVQQRAGGPSRNVSRPA